jgi:hypothetical protein
MTLTGSPVNFIECCLNKLETSNAFDALVYWLILQDLGKLTYAQNTRVL